MSHLAWKISVVNIVDIAVACLIDLATASRSLERATTYIDSCCRHKYAAEENKSAWELMAISFRALSSHASFIGIDALPLLDKSNKDASASNGGTLSVGKNWF